MSKIRWGILSTAKIGTQQVIPAMQRGTHTEISAIASRDLARAEESAKELGIAKAYGSYEELLSDPAIDAIYNPLPNHLHVPWTIKAIEAGKHVLCEKPIGLNTAEAEQLLAAAAAHPNIKVMEAFMYRHHPQWQRARALLASGSIGALRTVHTFFSYYNNDAGNIRNMADIGGGGLMDIGCYNISSARFLFDAEPLRVCGIVEYDPQFQTDRLASGLLDFGHGTSTFTCSTQLTPYQRVQAYGTEGRIEIEIPFNPKADQPSRIWHQRGGTIEEIILDSSNHYTLQGDLFSQAILNNDPVFTPLSDAVANMRVIDAIIESGKTNQWVAIS